MLIDSHCHLDFPDFEDELDQVIERAGEAGVGHMVTICTRVSKFKPVLAIAERYDNIACTVGIHPHNAGSEPETSAEQLIELSRHPKVVGIGETGLDFYYNKSPHDVQEKAFRAHIEASRSENLPVVVHTRDAEEDTIRILRDEHEKGIFPGLIHCFSGGHSLAQSALDLGLYISISGIATFKSAQEIRDVIAEVPLDRILVETDSPYLAPVPKRGKRNEPAFTAHTAECIAQVKGIDKREVAEATTKNFYRLFPKAKGLFVKDN